MKVKAFYKETENQGFWNGMEIKISRVPEKGELIKLNGTRYKVLLIETEFISDKESESIVYLVKTHYDGKLIPVDIEPETIYLMISCSIQKYDVKKVIKKVDQICKSLPNHLSITLIHGFLPHEEVKKRGVDTSWIDYIDDNFDQVTFYDVKNQKVRREEMIDFAKTSKALIFTLGTVEDGVKEEFELMQKAGLSISNLSL